MSADSPYVVLVVGATGQGKSALSNILVGKEDVFKEDDGMQACTKDAQSMLCEFDGKHYNIVDTMGLFDTDENAETCCTRIMTQVAEKGAAGIHAFLVTFKYERFTEQKQAQFELLKNLLGKDFTKHTVIVFTHKDELRVAEITPPLKAVFNDVDTHVCSMKEDPEPSRKRVFDAISELLEKKPQPYEPSQLQAAQAQIELLKQIQAELDDPDKADHWIRQFGKGEVDLKMAQSELKSLLKQERREKETARLAEVKLKEDAIKAKEEAEKRAQEAEKEKEEAIRVAQQRAAAAEAARAEAAEATRTAEAGFWNLRTLIRRAREAAVKGAIGGAAVGLLSEVIFGGGWQSELAGTYAVALTGAGVAAGIEARVIPVPACLGRALGLQAATPAPSTEYQNMDVP